MSDSDDASEAREGSIVPGTHRVIRMVDLEESPYRGALVECGDGVAVRKDAESLVGWGGWGHAGAEHVVGPIDVARRPDGHDVLLPWCEERVSVFVGRRRAVGVELVQGEVGTVVGSLLRGLGELDGGEGAVGGWWLTDAGKPMFVFGGDGGKARRGALDLIAQLREGVVDRTLGRVLDSVAKGLGEERVPARRRRQWEQELFDAAAPQPLRREIGRSERGPDLLESRAETGERAQRRAPVVASRTRRERKDAARGYGALGMGEHQRLRAGVILARVRTVLGRRTVPRRVRGAVDSGIPRRRRRPLVVAGVVAVVVLAAGLLWPTGDTVEAVAKPRDLTSATDEEGPASPSPTPEGASPAPASQSDQEDDVVAAGSRLLSALENCRTEEDALCASAVSPESTAVLSRVDQVEDLTVLIPSLVEDYGDIAVLSISTPEDEGTKRMLVLVRTDEKWLVRDIYEVADQPE